MEGDIRMSKNGLEMSVGILTISDRCSKGLAKDQSGPALKKIVEKHRWAVNLTAMVPDDRDKIKHVLINWSDQSEVSLILTTGGTGLGPRDVTPEITETIIDKKIPGIAEYIRQDGMKINYFSALSRAVSGVRKSTLIINLPGSPAGAIQSLLSVIGLIPHAIKGIRSSNLKA